jgi:ParB-like chromosome segregation protein Spo0J
VRWGRADGRRNKSCSAASRSLDRRHIALRDIAYAERLRGVNEGNVKRLVGSMREVGLINPIIL